MWNYIPRLPESSLCTSKIRVLKKPLLKDAIKTHTILGRHNTLETGIMDRWAVGWGVFSRHLQYPLQGSLVSPVLGILAILGGAHPVLDLPDSRVALEKLRRCLRVTRNPKKGQ